MKNKELQLRDVFCLDLDSDKTKEAITRFCEQTVIDLLNTDIMDWMSGFSILESEFMEAGKSNLGERSFVLDLTYESELIMKCIPRCEFIINEVDESSVGLGMKGSVSGIEKSWFEITGLFYSTADGSEIDLSESQELNDYLTNDLNIQQ